MKFFLIVAKGRKRGMPIPVEVDLFLIGSASMCQLRKRSLNSKQCAFVTRDKKVFVRDMDSGVDTLVNGGAIPTGGEWPVYAGDVVTIGSLEFMVQFREHALSQKDTEEWANNCLDVRKEEETDEEPRIQSRHFSAVAAATSILNRLNELKGSVKDRLRIAVSQGVTVVRVSDVNLLDESEIAATKKALCENLNRNNLRVLLDLKNVRKLSSNAVSMLGEFHRWLQPWGSTLALCRIRPELESAFSMFRMDGIPVFKDKDSALDAKW
jgi:anti-anti-sigma regulatory factor